VPLLAIGLLTLPADAAGARSRAAEEVPGSYIVGFRGDGAKNPRATTDRLERARGFRARFRYSRAVKGFAARLNQRQVERLQADPDVASVTPDRVVRAVGAVAPGELVPTGVRRFGAATTTRSWSPAAAKSSSAEVRIAASGCAARASATRCGFDVTTDASSSPGTASTSGAWNADPARP
jgi:hypothetical protein